MAGGVIHHWRAVSATALGGSHRRTGAPNQDAIAHRTYPVADNGLRAIIAVSDGHGSPKCIRSDTGSRLAVEVALACAKDFFDGPTADKSRFERELPRMLVAAWRDEVLKHARETPFTDAEYDKLGAEAGAPALAALREAAQRGDGATLHLAYGATILMVAVAGSGVFYAQLGDGDILAVSAAGEIESPIPEDASLIANETTSLCGRDASIQFRFGFHHCDKEPPALILASTDGYFNSFASPQGFRDAGAEWLRIIKEGGMPEASAMTAWLEKVSNDGSGDDVTLGILCRDDLIGPGTAACDYIDGTPE